MSALKTFTFRDANTLELRDDVVSSIVAFRSSTGAARTPPAEGVRNLGGGAYGVMLSDADVAAGTSFLVEPEPNVVPTHASNSAYPPSSPIHALHFEKPDGSLWDGDPPTVALYRSSAGADLLPHALVPLIAPYFYGISPSVSELQLGVSYLVVGAPGSIGVYEGSFFLGTSDEMSLVARIRTILLADGPVVALVGDRVHAVKAPDEAQQPYVVVSVISDVPESALAESDAEALSNARVQITSWAARYEVGHDVDKETTRVVAGLRAPAPGLSAWKANGPVDLYDDEAELFGASTDFNVWR